MDFNATQHSGAESNVIHKLKLHKVGLFGLILLVIIFVVVVVWLVFGSNKIKSENWQAVFLRNDQVYFGRLTISSNFYILRNVYYLQTEEEQEEDKLAPVSTASVNINKTKKKTNTKLVKLGNELHGPESEMFIEKTNVLFWENLKDNSSIVNSIRANEKSL